MLSKHDVNFRNSFSSDLNFNRKNYDFSYKISFGQNQLVSQYQI